MSDLTVSPSASASSLRRAFDPVTFEVLRHKFCEVAEEMGIILIRTSSSPVVTEAHDFASAIFAANGDLVAMSNNVIPHVVPMQIGVKSIISECADNPGINEGDLFLVNDPHRGAMHQSDIVLAAPAYFEGRLIGWTACQLHHLDVGAMIPGGFTTGATEIYQEGLRIPPMKLVERGVLRKDLWSMLFNHIRVARVALDLKAQIAANNIGGRRLVEICERYGADLVETAMEELLAFSDRRLRLRLKELPDGTYRHVDRQDHDGVKAGVYPIVLAVTKSVDALQFDFSGTCPQAEGFINTCLGGCWAGVFAVLAPWLCWDIPWNAGLLRPVTVIAPEASICNARLPAPVSKGGVGTMWSIRNAAQLALSKLFGCSDTYWQEAMAIWQGACLVPQPSGLNQYGKYFTYVIMDTVAGGSGAVAHRDGIDSGGIQASPTLSIPNVEHHEANHPLLYMFRRQREDSAGAGKYRGGCGIEEMFMVYDTDRTKLCLTGSGVTIPNAEGLFGGLPGSCNYWGVVRRERLPAAGNTLRLIRSFEEVASVIEQVSNGEPHFPLDRGDLFYLRLTGGGGYGDPLEREPSRVLKDVKNGLVSVGEAARLYGVAVRDGALLSSETEGLRRRILGRRFEGAMPHERHALAGHRVARRGEYLELREELGVLVAVCRCCGHRLSTGGADPKSGAILKEVELREAGPFFPADPAMPWLLRIYWCPGCGVQFAAEIAEKGSPILRDIELKVEQSLAQK